MHWAPIPISEFALPPATVDLSDVDIFRLLSRAPRRGFWITLIIFIVLIAFGFVAIAIVAAVIDMNRPDDRQVDLALPGPAVIGRDPLDAELARCSGLGDAGPREPSCLKAWADNRRRLCD